MAVSSKDSIEGITWLRAPHLVVYYFVLVLKEFAGSVATNVVSNWRTSLVVTFVAGLFALFMQNPPAAAAALRDTISEEGSFAVYWVLLGVLSSIGLGSGLHTFVLFLGPHVMRVANAAIRHGSTGFSARIHSYFSWPEDGIDVGGLAQAFSPRYADDAWEIAAADAEASAAAGGTVSFAAIVVKVAWACFLWGAGTALGELPPYFIARAAARAGQALEELNEVEGLEADVEHEKEEEERKKGGKKGGAASSSSNNNNKATGSSSSAAPHHHLSVADRAKVWVYEMVKTYGFTAILLAASIPNPLFDLAGLTCGHFGVSFWTFFGATFIGKAVVKVSIQALFIIALTKYGPLAFDTVRTSLPEGTVVRAWLTSVEASYLKSQSCICASEGTTHACEACCGRNFKPAMGLDQCLSTCGSAGGAGGGEGECAHGGGGGGGSLVKDLWGYFLTAMILYFVASIITSLVHEYLVRQLTQGAEASPKAKAAATAAAAAPASPPKKAVAGSPVAPAAPPLTPKSAAAAAAAGAGAKATGVRRRRVAVADLVEDDEEEEEIEEKEEEVVAGGPARGRKGAAAAAAVAPKGKAAAPPPAAAATKRGGRAAAAAKESPPKGKRNPKGGK